MNTRHQFRSIEERELLSFWAFGDLHFGAAAAWHATHTRRLAPMFEDLHLIWQEEGKPAFCVSPGDLVETCEIDNYRVARETLKAQLGDIPFYPGIGNHEYCGPIGEDPTRTAKRFSLVWEKPVRYAWEAGEVVCIMLDYPDPHALQDAPLVFLEEETLAFLDSTLTAYAHRPALIFLHCPLYNTVLDRDPRRYRDFNSLQSFFSPENSQEVRAILARHHNACLYISGHTHSGWEAPGLVSTEELGGHPVTFVSLMSPWYTGTHTGARLSADRSTVEYVPDDPNVIPTFSIRIYSSRARIRVRDHLSRRWLKEWIVPLSGVR